MLTASLLPSLLARGSTRFLRLLATMTNVENDSEYTYEVREGQAKVLFKNQYEAFYNPVQEFNRDLSIAVIQLYLNKIKEENEGKEVKGKTVLLEALGATGLR